MSEHVKRKRRLAAEYRFSVGNLEPEVQVRSGRIWLRAKVIATSTPRATYIQSPAQASPYMSSRTSGTLLKWLLDDAVSGFETFYQEDAWLDPNEDFWRSRNSYLKPPHGS